MKPPSLLSPLARVSVFSWSFSSLCLFVALGWKALAALLGYMRGRRNPLISQALKFPRQAIFFFPSFKVFHACCVMSRLLVVSGRRPGKPGAAFTLEETEVPSLRYVLSLLDRITEDLPKPYNRLAPLHVSMATHGLPVWHHQLHVCIFACVVEAGEHSTNIHSHPFHFINKAHTGPRTGTGPAHCGVLCAENRA